VAHTLKGAVSNFAAGQAQQLAGRLEALGREGRLAETAAVLAELEAELARLAALFAEPGWAEAAGTARQRRLRPGGNDGLVAGRRG
jgi:HPt (histidine-containing phosphotransfer) domain-containing protein